jgi:tetratricopeptide (TPR) repeat protein
MTARAKIALLAVVLIGVAGRSRTQDAGDRIKALDAEARSAEAQGHLDVAIEKYQQILKSYPKLPAAYNNLGRLYYQAGRFRDAIEPLNHAAELDPTLEAPHAQLGFCFFQLGDFVGAQREFETALKLSPNDGVAQLFLARSLLELRDVNGAVKLLDLLHDADPNNVEVLFSLGWAYADLAVSTLGDIQKADPDSYLIDVLQGKYAEVRQAYAEAAEHYKKALAKSPNQPDLCYDYAHALWASGDFPAALQQYRHALELNPGDYRASWEAARIALLDNPQDALELATRALELKPDIAEALAIRGRALLALGKPSSAVDDLKKATALDPNNAGYYFQLARAYRQLGRADQANDAQANYERLQRQAHSIPAEDAQASPR